ncbi:MAG TPA: FHA domain-containing protein [Pyrinomonadaceae bacterium]|nr:FHA domain-containing protein [Pyrinomonadaceae bacterium]
MTICERCSTENLDGSQYCDECGAPLSAAAALKKPAGTGNSGSQTDSREIADAQAALARSQEQLQPASAASSAGAAQPSAAYAVSSGSIALMDGAHARLVIERGRSAGKQFPLSDDESQIGRWDADGGIFPDVDLDADDPEAKVSRRHARIMRRNGQYFIEDLGSTNGTFINRGRRLLPGDRQPLRDGDEIIVGKTFLRFHIVQ